MSLKLFFISLLCCLFSCSAHNKDKAEIETLLGITLSYGIKHVYVHKELLDDSYMRPRNEYIRLECDVKTFQQIVDTLHLISAMSPDRNRLLCLENQAKFLPFHLKRFISIQSRNKRYSKAEQELDWWQPDPDNGDTYIGHYTMTGPHRVVPCGEGLVRDGRIVAQYAHGNTYILIEE